MPTNRRKRRALKQKNVSCIYPGNLVWDHYIKGIKRYQDLSS
jgi:hypothetical protein